MLRTLLIFIILLIVIAIALVGTGIINLRQNEQGGVSLRTSDVDVGSGTTNVKVPVIRLEERQMEVPRVAIDQGNGTEVSVNAQ